MVEHGIGAQLVCVCNTCVQHVFAACVCNLCVQRVCATCVCILCVQHVCATCVCNICLTCTHLHLLLNAISKEICRSLACKKNGLCSRGKQHESKCTHACRAAQCNAPLSALLWKYQYLKQEKKRCTYTCRDAHCGCQCGPLLQSHWFNF